jgi:D-alanyl-lipoteichoic acid acyltransferase DltB (MBOAT superfamily)
MVFSSYAFICEFLPLAFVGFLVCAQFGPRWAAVWLVIASLAFYAYWRVSFLPLLLISIVFNFSIGSLLARTSERPALQNALLLFGIAADLLALIYYKYAAAIAESLGFSSVGGIAFQDIILPLGISFFTFTQIGYLVDVKQGVAKKVDFLRYLQFVTFFPHLIAGPILHNREMMPQFADPATYRFSGRNFVIGLTIFSIGLAKKVLLADPLSSDVAWNFSAAQTAGMTASWYAVVAYSMQLYFDFSGYSDMAIGLARLFNVKFPLNFNSPYKATTVIDYWQRWHMTLTRFITMYIFTPLALWVTRLRSNRGMESSRRATATPGGFLSLVAFPTIMTMCLAGIWHGAGLQYFVFGLLHGVYIAVNHAIKIFFPAPKHAEQRPWPLRAAIHAAKVLAVYVAALVAFVFFRSSSMTSAIDLLEGMVGFHGLGAAEMIKPARIAILFGVVWLAPNTQQIMTKFEPALGRSIANPYEWLTWKPNWAWSIALGLIAGLAFLELGSAGEFLYFQF